MPIHEFRCLKCQQLFEVLLLRREEQEEVKCPHCAAMTFERVISVSSHAMGGSGAGPGARTESRSCAGGSCTTYHLPGPGE
jgi:putative FmdB family regulatory protein